MTYVGLALRSSFKAHEVWDTIVEKMQQRLGKSDERGSVPLTCLALPFGVIF